MNAQPAITPEQQLEVEQLLGRKPRGLREIPLRREQGTPMVIRVASLVEGKPFPTLYWLTDPAISLRIDREEAGGLIKRFQAQVDASPDLQAEMVQDHRHYIDCRNQFMSAQELAELNKLGFYDALQSRGIGGIGNFRFIRCLHTWYAAHLVMPNTIGRMLDQHWQSDD